MKHAWIRWVMYGVALLVLGPVAGAMTGSLRAADGGSDATLLVSTTPLRGLFVGLGVLAIAGVLGVATARLVSGRAGLIAAGLVVAWAAWRSGEADEIIRRAQSASPLWSFALEAAIMGLGTLLVAAAILRVAQREHHVGLGEPKGEGPDSWKSLVPGPQGLVGLGAGVALGAAAAWFVGVDTIKGQMVAATIVAGLIAGTAARIADAGCPVTVPVLAVCILGIAGPAAGAVMHDGKIVAALYAGRLMPLAGGVPLDWSAGALIGTPLGLAWAGSLMERRR